MDVIILAGGSGTRLWPLSRGYFPKQFLKLDYLNSLSLFQLTFKRALKISKLEEIFIVTNEKQKFLCMGQIEELNIKFPEKNIIIEPTAKNTLPAIILGMKYVKSKVLILPSDHLIKNENIFIENLQDAKNLSNSYLVTFSIQPTEPHTGYGYIKHKNNIVCEFKEKPSKILAQEYIQNNYLWNSGMFLFDKKLFFEELIKIDPSLNNILEIDDVKELYDKLPNVSIDYGILEKSSRVATIPLKNIGWTDLGSFDSIYDVFEKDENGNLGDKNIRFFESKNNFVHTYKDKMVILDGINNLIIIDTDDALLICERTKSENIKKIINSIKGDNKLYFHTTVYRPWGSFTILENNENYKVKKLSIMPNKILSLQKHKFRSENWTVISGQASVINGDKNFILKKSESTYIPKETIHRLENKTSEILEIIEIQTGDYFGEDDIERFEDKYGRK